MVKEEGEEDAVSKQLLLLSVGLFSFLFYLREMTINSF